MKKPEKNLILLVEDEEPIADTITYALKTEGFLPEWVSTCGEARDFLNSRRPDLIILDINLPDGNGFDLCREIRQVDNTPILFLTSRSSEIDRVVGLEMGADDYVVKPFSPRELTARVRAILRRAGRDAVSREKGESSPATPFTVDEERHIITYFGEPLTLSRYEYRILKLLISRPGRVFTREQIMELVWEEPEASFDRTIDTHIKNIRLRARSVRADLDPITTHRGSGYSLKESW